VEVVGFECDMLAQSDSEITALAPWRAEPGFAEVTLAAEGFEDYDAGDIEYLDIGYRVFTRLMSGSGQKYRQGTVANVKAAAWGEALSIAWASMMDLYAVESRPERSVNCIADWEWMYGLPIPSGPTLADRQAVVLTAHRRAPRIAKTWIDTALSELMGYDPEIVEREDYDVYGDLIWLATLIVDPLQTKEGFDWAAVQRECNVIKPSHVSFQLGQRYLKYDNDETTFGTHVLEE